MWNNLIGRISLLSEMTIKTLLSEICDLLKMKVIILIFTQGTLAKFPFVPLILLNVFEWQCGPLFQLNTNCDDEMEHIVFWEGYSGIQYWVIDTQADLGVRVAHVHARMHIFVVLQWNETKNMVRGCCW